jgi:hypothetical protein
MDVICFEQDDMLWGAPFSGSSTTCLSAQVDYLPIGAWDSSYINYYYMGLRMLDLGLSRFGNYNAALVGIDVLIIVEGCLRIFSSGPRPPTALLSYTTPFHVVVKEL